MPFRSLLSETQDDLLRSPTGVESAIDLNRVGKTLQGSLERTADTETQRVEASAKIRTQRAQPTEASSKIFFNPRSKQYYVGGRSVPARYDTLKFLSEADNLPDQVEAPAGFVPISQDALKLYTQQIHAEMEGTAPTQLWDALKTTTGAAVAAIPRLLGYDWQNNFEGEAEESYKNMSLREQAGADEGAFDSLTGFTNSAARGVGSAIPTIGSGVLTTALTANPVLGTAVATGVGFASAAGDDSESSQNIIAQALGQMSDEDRREASDAYAALRDHGVPEDIAIDQVAFNASRVAGLVGGATTIPETLIGAKLFGGLFRKIPGIGAWGDEAVATARKGMAGKILSDASAKLAKIPAPLRFLGRMGTVGVGEGVQEEAETTMSQAAGNYAAGVGETDPLKLVTGESFKEALPAGLVFGALANAGRPRAPSEIELALSNVENTNNPAPIQAPPTAPQVPGMPPQDIPLPRQLELVENILGERYGANWRDNIAFLEQDPGARQLIGQFSGIQQEMQRAAGADPNAPVDPFTGAPGDGIAHTPRMDGTPPVGAQPDMFGGRSLTGEEPIAPAPEVPTSDPAQQELPLEQDPRRAAVITLVQITGAQSPQELIDAIPQLQALAEQEPQIGELLAVSGLVPASEPSTGLPPPSLAERRAFQQMQLDERAAASTENPALLPSSGVAEIEQQIAQLQAELDRRPPKDPVRRQLAKAMQALEAQWQEAKLAAGPQGVDPSMRVDAPEPPNANTERTPDGRPLGVAPAPLVNPEPMSPEEAASRAQTQAERGGAPVVGDQLPVDLEPIQTTPEPAEDIAAQIAALGDPTSQRDAVFIAEGNLDEAGQLPVDQIPEGVMVAERPGVGVLLTTNKAKAAQFSKMANLTDATIGRLIGIPTGKAEVAKAAAKSGKPMVVVQAVTPDGAVQAEAVTTPPGKARAIAAAKKQATSKAKVVETTPEAAQARRTVKLGPKGEAARATATRRENDRAAETVKKKSAEGVADEPLIPAEATAPVTGELGVKIDGRAVMAPKSLIVETGASEGPVNLRTQSIDEANRGRLTGLLQRATTSEAKRLIQKVLDGYTRVEAMLDAAAAKAEKALLAKIEADPDAKAQYEVELASQDIPVGDNGRPRTPILYALPLLDSELQTYVDRMVAQATFELRQNSLQPDKSVAIKMLQQAIPSIGHTAMTPGIMRDILTSISALDAASKTQLIKTAYHSLRDSTLAKKVVRGASEVAHVAGRGESTDRNSSRVYRMENLTRLNKPFTTGYGSVPKQAVQLVNDWAQLFERVAGKAMAKDLRVMTVADARALLPNRPDIRAGLTGGYIRAEIEGKPVHIIAVDWNNLPEEVAIEALAHEFGHFVTMHIYDKSATIERAAIKLAYSKWREANGKKSPIDIMRSRLAPASAKYLDDDATISPLYATDFLEWSADNAARWLLTKKEPRSVVEKYFAQIAKVLRAIYDTVLGKGAPDRTWAMVLDAWTARARAQSAVPDAMHDQGDGWEAMRAEEELEVSGRERVEERLRARESVQAMEPLKSLRDALGATLPDKGITMDSFRQSTLGDKVRQYGLQLLTTHQIADMYANTPVGKTLRSLVTIRDRIDSKARQLQGKGSDALAKALNLSAAAQDLLQEVMYLGTYYNVNPEVDYLHPSNAHLQEGTKEVVAEKARRYDKARAVYNELVRVDNRAAEIYAELRDAFEDLRSATIQTKIDNLKRENMSDAAVKKLQSKLEELQREKRQGPYFPLMRTGDWIVHAILPSTAYGKGGKIAEGGSEFTNKTDATKELNNLKAQFPGAEVKIESEQGKYVVRVYPRGVYFFNSEAEARKAMPDIEREIRDEYKVHNADYDATVEALSSPNENAEKLSVISQPFKKLSTYETDQQASSDEFMRELRALMKDDKVSQQFADAVEEMYLESLPEFSYRKSQMRRENILGASKKMLFSYSHRYAGAAHNLATISHSRELNKAWDDLKNARKEYAPAADIANTISLNDQLVKERTTPTPGNRVLNMVSDLNSFYSLALSPAYVLTNAMQVGMVSLPVLAGMTDVKGKGIGLTKAASYIKDAYAGAGSFFTKRGMQDFMSEAKRVLGKKSEDVGTADHIDAMLDRFAQTPDERQMLQELLDRGRLDFSFLNSLQDAMRSGKAGMRFGALMRLGMAFPQQVEAMNRVVTALATYRLATKEMGLGRGESTLGDVIELVDTTVRKTQLDYSRKNRPALFNRPIVGMVLQFRLFMQGMYMLFTENAVKALRGASPAERQQGLRTLAYLLGTHASVGGLTGISPVVWMATLPLKLLAAAGLGGDDEDKWKSMDDMMRQMATDYFGKTGGRVLMNGLPTLLNVDVSERLGMPTLYDAKYAGVTERTKPADAFDKTFLYLMGSPYANARRVYTALAEASDGNFGESAKGLPSGFRAAMRTLTFMKDGITDKDGDVFVPRSELSNVGLAISALGFQTADVAEAYRERSAKFNAKGRIGIAREELLQEYRTADPGDRGEVWKKVRAYNATVPKPFRLSLEQLQDSLEAKKDRDAGKKNRQDAALDKMFD